MKQSIIITLLFIATLFSCTDNSTSSPIDTIDFTGQWKCADLILEFKTTNSVIDTITHDNITYTFNSDSTFICANEVFFGLPFDQGTYSYNESLNQLIFTYVPESSSTINTFKNAEYAWRDIMLENDTLKVNFIKKLKFSDGTSSMTNQQRRFIKL